VTRACNQQFRLKLIFYNELATIQAIPLNGVPSVAGHEVVGCIVRGKEDLVSLISDIEIDSVVRTRQLGTQEFGDDAPPKFQRIFNMLVPSQIINTIEEYFETDRVDIVLGSTKLSPSKGFQRMTNWFRQRALV
jgi:hypothetical protein